MSRVVESATQLKGVQVLIFMSAVSNSIEDSPNTESLQTFYTCFYSLPNFKIAMSPLTESK